MSMLKTTIRVILISIWSFFSNPIFAQGGFNLISADFDIAPNNEAKRSTKIHLLQAWFPFENGFEDWEWRLGIGSVMFQKLYITHPTKGSSICFWELGPYGFRRQLGSGFSIEASGGWYFGPGWNDAHFDDLYMDGPSGQIAFEKTIPIETVGAIQVRLGHRWSRGISITTEVGADPRINLGTYYPHYPGSFLQFSFGIGSWDDSYYRIRKKPKKYRPRTTNKPSAKKGSNQTQKPIVVQPVKWGFQGAGVYKIQNNKTSYYGPSATHSIVRHSILKGTTVTLTGSSREDENYSSIRWAETVDGDWIMTTSIVLIKRMGQINPSSDREVLENSTPPILKIEKSSVQFTDENANQLIDALEKTAVIFNLSNSGPGDGYGLEVAPSISGSTVGITIGNAEPFLTIPAGESREIKIPITSSRFTENGQIQITVEIVEPNGFSPEPLTIEVASRAFAAPQLEVVDFSSTLTPWIPNSPIGLDVLIQNTGKGLAEKTTIQLDLPPSINCYSNNTNLEIPSIQPGESVRVTYDMIVPRNYNQSEVSVTVQLKEKHGDYGSSWNQAFAFKRENTENVLSIQSLAKGEVASFERATLAASKKSNAEVTFNRTGKKHDITAVAVIGKMVEGCDGKSKSADELASYTENNILAFYDVIERRHFEDILSEHRLQMSGLTFEETLIEKGCIENAQGYLFVESGCLLGDEMIQLKLVHCESSDLVWSCTGINATAKETLDKVSEGLTKK